jgi:hypothetical protein
MKILIGEIPMIKESDLEETFDSDGPPEPDEILEPDGTEIDFDDDELNIDLPDYSLDDNLDNDLEIDLDNNADKP